MHSSRMRLILQARDTGPLTAAVVAAAVAGASVLSWRDTAPPAGTSASQPVSTNGAPGIRASSPAPPVALQWSVEPSGHAAAGPVLGKEAAAACGSGTNAAVSAGGWLRRMVAAAVSLPLPLLLTVSHADGSGYDAMKGHGPAAATLEAGAAAAAAAAVPAASGGEAEDDPDTITGVFHRLDRNRAKLRLVQVVFRWAQSGIRYGHACSMYQE